MLDFNLAVRGDDVENNLHYRFPIYSMEWIFGHQQASLLLDVIEIHLQEIEDCYVQDLSNIDTKKWGIIFSISIDAQDFKHNLQYSTTLPGGMLWFERNKDDFVCLIRAHMESIRNSYYRDLLDREKDASIEEKEIRKLRRPLRSVYFKE